jgi:hypothetical protein
VQLTASDNPYVERIIGSIRRECLDCVIIFNETHLRRVLSSYFRYYHRTTTHLSLGLGQRTVCATRRSPRLGFS